MNAAATTALWMAVMLLMIASGLAKRRLQWKPRAPRPRVDRHKPKRDQGEST